MKEYLIRPAQKNDLETVAKLTEEAYAVPYREGQEVSRPHPEADLEGKFIAKDFFVLVAEEAGKIIGAVRHRFIDDYCYIFKLAVLPQMRKQGLGRKLMQAVEKIARNNQYKTLKLDCMKEKGLVPYYEKQGFFIEKTKKHHDHHDVYMSRKII